MTADGTPGAKNQPQFLGGGAPSTAPDLNTIANYAALVGNTKAVTSTERLALAGADRWDGLLVTETDTGRVYVYIGGWQLLAAAPGLIAERGSFVTSSAIAMDANTSQAITFTAGRFTAAPMVIAVCSNGRVSIAVNSATTSGATLSLSNWSSGSMAAGQTVWWVAIQ